jgi:hypothetical protein
MVRSSERTGPSTGVRRPVARTAAAARARQVPFDLAACQLHLLEHQLRQRAGPPRGVGQDRQRRVHRVRQVAGLVRALHHVGVFAQHVVELAHQRLQLPREVAGQLRRLAAAHRRQALAQQLERRSASCSCKATATARPSASMPAPPAAGA